MEDSFAAFEFLANKPQLGAILNRNTVDISLIQVDGAAQELGRVTVPLKMLEEGEHKKTVDSMVIVSDKFLEIKKFEEVIGLLRVVLYLQDMGPASE